MIAINDIVECEIVRVEVYGIYCRYEDLEILVLIPETSWIASFSSCKDFAQPGDYIRVKILNISTDASEIAATIKGCYPNPWESSALSVGEVMSGRVVRRIENSNRCENRPGYLVEILPGSYCVLCEDENSLSPSDTVNVRIEKTDPKHSSVVVTSQIDSENDV